MDMTQQSEWTVYGGDDARDANASDAHLELQKSLDLAPRRTRSVSQCIRVLQDPDARWRGHRFGRRSSFPPATPSQKLEDPNVLLPALTMHPLLQETNADVIVPTEQTMRTTEQPYSLSHEPEIAARQERSRLATNDLPFEQQLTNGNPEATTNIDEAKSFGTSLLKINTLTNDVLQRRTEWRFEYQKLQDRKVFLHNSLEDLVITVSAKFGVRHDGTVNHDAAMSYDETRPNNDYVHESLDHEDEQMRSGTTSPISKNISNIQQLHGQFKKDYDAVLEHEKKATHIADGLDRLEYELVEEQKAILAKMRSQKFVSRIRKEMVGIIKQMLAQPVPSSKASSENSLPPLVAQYFNVRGNIGVYTERLQELDFNYEEGRMEREFLKERGDHVNPPDAQFDQNYRLRREKIVNDLRNAEEDAEIHRKRCEDAGLDPNDHRTSGNPTSMFTSARTSSDNASGIAQIREVQHTIPLPPFVIPDTGNRIDDWRRNVSTVDPEDFLDHASTHFPSSLSETGIPREDGPTNAAPSSTPMRLSSYQPRRESVSFQVLEDPQTFDPGGLKQHASEQGEYLFSKNHNT